MRLRRFIFGSWIPLLVCSMLVSEVIGENGFELNNVDGKNNIEKFDKYGGVKSIKGTATGWIHVEELNGRWYFVSPEGHAFFAIGATHAIELIRKDERDIFQKKYKGDATLLAEKTLADFREWGYNSLGYASLPAMQNGMPYVGIARTNGPMSTSAGKKSKYMDIFNPKIQNMIRERIVKSVTPHIDNPYCMGYVFIDLPTWHNEFSISRFKLSYVDFMRGLGPHAAGKKAYVKFLKKRYDGDFERIKKVYGVQSSSFEELRSEVFDKIDRKNSEIKQDDEVFLNLIADKYYQFVVSEIRKLDSHHLILGDRLMADSNKTYDSILQIASRYVDVISFQPMGTKNLIHDYLEKVYEITQKPILLADVNCVMIRPKKDQKNTEELEKIWGEHTLRYYTNAASSKYCIGIHRCTIRDYRPWDPRFHRKGLIKDDESPYPILIDYTKRTNKLVYEMVYGTEGVE